MPTARKTFSISYDIPYFSLKALSYALLSLQSCLSYDINSQMLLIGLSHVTDAETSRNNLGKPGLDSTTNTQCESICFSLIYPAYLLVNNNKFPDRSFEVHIRWLGKTCRPQGQLTKTILLSITSRYRTYMFNKHY